MIIAKTNDKGVITSLANNSGGCRDVEHPQTHADDRELHGRIRKAYKTRFLGTPSQDDGLRVELRYPHFD